MFLKLKRIHQKRLAKLALALLNATSDSDPLIHLTKNRTVEFNMKLFGAVPEDAEDVIDPLDPGPCDVHSCGTACCFIGYAPFVFRPVRQMENFEQAQEWVTGIDPHECGSAGDFILKMLFNGQWPSDPLQAAARALIVLRGGEGLPRSVKAMMSDMADDEYTYMMSLEAEKAELSLDEYFYDLKFYRNMDRSGFIEAFKEFL